MYCLRRVALRALTVAPTPTTSIGARAFSRATERTSATSIARPFTPRLHRRWLADEAASTQSEPVTDGAEETKHDDSAHSIASAPEPEDPVAREPDIVIESGSFEPPKTQEEAAVAATDPSTATESVVPEEPSTVDTAKETVQSAAAKIRQAVTGSSSAATATGQPKTNLYVGNLFFDVREEDLAQEFGRAGPVKATRIIKDARGLSKGFGYVEFANETDAQKAIQIFHMQEFEGRKLTVQPADNDRRTRTPRTFQRDQEERAPNPPSKTLFIGNMSFDMSDRDLNTLFRGVKNVIDVRVAIDRRTGQPRGFAHADFTDMESAKKAFDELRGKVVCGRNLRVDFSHSTGRAALGTE